MTEVEEIRALSTAELLRRLASYTQWMGLPHTQPRLLSTEASRRAEALSDRDRVCHDDQMVVWSGEVVARLAMGDYLRDDLDYDDNLAVHAAVSDEIRSIIGSAFEHPELAVSTPSVAPADAVVFLDMPEEAVLQARAELRKAFVNEGSARWMKDLAADAALERIFNIFRANAPAPPSSPASVETQTEGGRT